MSHETSYFSLIASYKETIEQLIRISIVDFGPKTDLRDACEYALMNGGKRFRPALVMMIAKALGNDTDVSQAALGIEFFHTASLIADDLPCMDNDDKRRDQLTVHKVYGESTALLATYALIAAGYACIAKNAALFKDRGDVLCRLALENAALNTGILGATGGQFMDLFPSDLSLETARTVIEKKTVTLFEISFVYGWLFGGGDVDLLPLVKRCACHFGMAFQIADDIHDRAQDLTQGASLNWANLFGYEQTMILFQSEIQACKQLLGELHLLSDDLLGLIESLEQAVN